MEMRRKFTMLLAMAASVVSFTALADPYPPLDRHTFVHDGIEREYFVHAPSGRTGELPVVLAIHGYGSTATGFAVFHDLNEHANRNGYIVVYPQGSHFAATNEQGRYRVTSWNMLGNAVADLSQGPQCTEDADIYPCPPECGECDRCGWASCYDDLGYFTKLLDDLEAEYSTDRSRYYALGMSNGGMMVLRLGCSMSGRFAAIAPISAQLPAGFDCGPTTPLPMLHLTGGLDDVVRPDGKPSGDGFIYVSSAKTAESWANALDCDGTPVAWKTEESKLAGVVCTAYTNCAVEGQEVVSCVDSDETHNWPARRPGGAWPTCVTSQQVEAMPEQKRCEPRTDYGPHRGMDLIWDFFSRYQKQSAHSN